MNIEETRKRRAQEWFSNLRDQICETLQNLEKECYFLEEIPACLFQKNIWKREGGGGGEISFLKNGRVFEKAGVNISTVHGEFSESFRQEIPGASEDPQFWASGLSLVLHPRNPHVPIIHMNTRMIVTTKLWFGGGIDLTPVLPDLKDIEDFHRNLKEICDLYQVGCYQEFKEWCDRYFFIQHRKEPRGVGGIFYDYVDSGNWEKDFSFMQEVGRTFLKTYPKMVRRHYNTPWSELDLQKQLEKRGRYVEFNLMYDRGTRFGLQTEGNIEAILISLPPVAGWEFKGP